MKKIYLIFLCVISLIFFNIKAFATEKPEKIGVILKLTGAAYLIQNADQSLKLPRPLREQEAVYVGDVIQTQNASLMNIQFLDQSRVLLRADSTFTIREFSYETKTTQPQRWRAFFEILAGSFRTISGKIGKTPSTPEQYQVKTPIGLIGIRGTDYEVVLCEAEACPAPSGQKNTEKGALLAVHEGKIVVFLGEKIQDVAQGEYALAFTDGQITVSRQPFANFVENPSPSPVFCE